MEIEDLNFFIKEILKEEKVDKVIALNVKEKIKALLRSGDVPESFYINLYFNFPRLEEDEFLLKTKETLSNYFKTTNSVEEKILINNLIFVLDILNGKDGLAEFVSRGLKIPYLAYLSNVHTQEFLNFFKKSLNPDILLRGFKLSLENFFELNEIERRSVFVNALSILWNNPSLFVNKKWLEIFDDLVGLIDYSIENNLIEEEMYIHFFTYHIYGNNIHTIKEWEQFNEKVEKKASLFYKRWGEEHNLIPSKRDISNGKKKIGILFDRLVLNSPFMVMYSLIEHLLKDKNFIKEYEIVVYSMSYIDKNEDDEKIIQMLKEKGVRVVSNFTKFKDYGFYYPHLKKAIDLREHIINDKIDYLISMTFGYDIPNFIFSNRSAPVQIYWSHGNCTSEILNIDKRISHFAQECEGFEIVEVPLVERFLKGSSEEKNQGEILKKSLKETFGDVVFLGTIGRLVKIDRDEYIEVLSKIMKNHPNTVYLACGSGNKESIRDKLRKYGIDEKRVIFTGQVNPHIFGWVIDIWLDTFPLLQGQSRNEFEAKGGAIVGLENLYSKNFIETLNKVTSKDILAKDINDYILKAEKLIEDSKWRKEVGNIFKRRIEEGRTFDRERFKECINILK